METYLASVMLFGGNFAPRGWALCQGQILSIAQNTALFSLLGTTYGGNGQTTFALPDLRGRAVVGAGQGNGLSPYDLGQLGGVESTTLISSQMPMHTHPVTMTVTPGSSSSAATTSPTNAVYAPDGGGNPAYSSAFNASMAPYPVPLTTSVTGSNIPFSNRNPYLVINHIICLQGVFPARN